MSLKIDSWICKCICVWECAHIDTYPVSIHEHISRNTYLYIACSLWSIPDKENENTTGERILKNCRKKDHVAVNTDY